MKPGKRVDSIDPQDSEPIGREETRGEIDNKHTTTGAREQSGSGDRKGK